MPKAYAYMLGLASVCASFLLAPCGLYESECLATPRRVFHKAKPTKAAASRGGKTPHRKSHPDLAHLPPMRLGGPLPIAAYASPIARPTAVAAVTAAATAATPSAAVKPVAPPPPPPVAAVGPKGKHLRGKAPVVAAPPPPSDGELLQEAQDAYIQGERQKAIDLALGVAEKGSASSPAAWKFIGLAACSVHSLRLATRAYQSVSAADQKKLSDACRVNGLQYQGDRFIEK